ncbi:hypothetical protein [Ahrensia kielensis]|uniref:hypothetical protein n=1 Tax=Ahrensia kielensis TaxID=76980 RepID=UPI0003733E8F|nr:hypothetical protein [Ahrensia kielensis]
MTLQNRVTPFGNIIADKARGLFTGNRGIIHNPDTRSLLPSRRWTSKAWIICLCSFKERRRDVFGRNGKNGGTGWSELFFLDEATALAAGHRPCFYCQRARATMFQAAFSTGQSESKMSAPQMDKLLHAERLNAGKKRLHTIANDWRSLPDGTIVGNQDRAYLISNQTLFLWKPEGYQHDDDAPQYLITPPSIVAALRSGYQPVLHDSALSR